MKKIKLLFFFIFVSFCFAKAQTYNNPGGNVSTCSGNFYDAQGSGTNYTNNQNITTTFCSSSGNCIRVAFTAFSTESGYDFLYVYDGPNTSSTLLGTFSGSTLPGTFTSSTGCLTFRFTSDGSTVSSGWAATISCVACPAWNGNINTSTQNITCPGPVNFYDDGGNGSNYSASKDYTFTATSATAGQCLVAAFSSFSTEASYDILKIYDGVGTGGTLIGTYSGSTIPPNATSSGGSLTFVWHSDGSSQSTGWAATISCTACPPPPPPSTNMNNTPVSLTCPTSLLFYDSGGSGGNYSSSESYTKTVTASAGSCVSYTFSAFNTESGYDYLSVYDGPSTASPLIGTYAGTALPPNYTASGNSLTFRFTSDGSGQYAGWTATVSCANACSGAPTAGTAAASPTAQCGSFTTTLSLSGSSTGCGITYQWYQSNAAAGTYTSIGSASSTSTQTFTVTSTKYFKCVTLCGASSATSAVISAAISPTAVGTGVFPVSLPYSITGQTTCGFIDDITSSNVANVCGNSNFYTGEDVVYIFTPTLTASFNATVTSGGTRVGLTLYNGCPTSTGICVANSQSASGTQSITGCGTTVNAGTTYYLIIDSRSAPVCNPYDLSMSLVGCTGTPTVGTAIATPSTNCSNFTTTLTLTGNASGCGTVYQWYHSNSAAGSYTATGTASTSVSQTFAITSATPKFFKCVATCAAFSATSAVITASVNANSAGTGSFPVSLPYSASGQTTCGFINDITSSNVTNVCGSASYYTGEDVVYIFTPSTTGIIDAAVTSSGSYVGMMLYQGCPTGTGVCVANAQSSSGNQSFGGCGSSTVSVTAGLTYFLILDSYASPSCNPYSITLAMATSTFACNMAYTPSTTTFSFETLSAPTLLPTTDDVLFADYIDFGFPICYDGKPYTGGYVASNSAFVFDAVPCFPNISSTTYAAGGVSTGYSISGAAPINGTSVPRNAILAPWHDINPASSAVVASSKIQYQITGTAPNRKVIISWENIPMYSGSCESIAASRASSQVKLFEFDSSIEIHIKNKQVCSTWNGGDAILGLHNYNGTQYVPPVNATAHNYPTDWTMTNTAYKFTSSCNSSPSCLLVLPIGFIKFYGDNIENVNTLFWQTATEENMDYFIVERSTDAINFENIGKITANNRPSSYTFKDYENIKGMINYYRITSVEKDLNTSQTNIISIGASDDEILSTWPIYPNPANTEEIFVRLNSKKIGVANFIVYDVLGNIVVDSKTEIETGVKVYGIDISKLSLGIYYVEVKNSFNEPITKQKLIINK
jgi:hypothetical protein